MTLHLVCLCLVTLHLVCLCLVTLHLVCLVTLHLVCLCLVTLHLVCLCLVTLHLVCPCLVTLHLVCPCLVPLHLVCHCLATHSECCLPCSAPLHPRSTFMMVTLHLVCLTVYVVCCAGHLLPCQHHPAKGRRCSQLGYRRHQGWVHRSHPVLSLQLDWLTQDAHTGCKDAAQKHFMYSDVRPVWKCIMRVLRRGGGGGGLGLG